jgi:hypothetical protein
MVRALHGGQLSQAQAPAAATTSVRSGLMNRKQSLASLRRHTTFHEPNSCTWQPGDIVIHDADAKRPDMLMVVIGCSRAGVYRTRYLFPAEQPKNWRKKIWRNTIEPLHDPRRFGIALRDTPEVPLTLDAIRESTFFKS